MFQRALSRFVSSFVSSLPALVVGVGGIGGIGGINQAQAQALAADGRGFTQVPGVYRQVIGGLQVTALFDGVVLLPAQHLTGMPASRAKAWQAASHVPHRKDGLQTAINAFLVQRGGDELVLVDAGTADCLGPTAGQVLSNLRAAGVRPEEVKQVLLTHAHPDHLCGLLTAAGEAAYPNATVWLAKADADHWLSTAQRDSAPAPMRSLFDMARRAVAPYQAAGRFKAFGVGDALPANVQAVASPGHTPGHTSWRFAGDGGQAALLVWGDVVHYHAVQLRNPKASYEHDHDARQAIASLQRVLAQAAAQGTWVAGAHLPFPGMGHVQRAEGQGAGRYRWVPAEFGPTGVP